jgi:zinc and cadmium transporter
MELAIIVLAGLAMSAIALIGSVTTMLSETALARIVMPLVGLSAGSLLGGALFFMLPQAVRDLSGVEPFVWVAAGFVSFLVLEQFLGWHHCHRPVAQHAPVGKLILLADGLHNFVGGLAVGGAFLIDVRVGAAAWLVAAAHEVPQELGDFGILVHSGWSRRAALGYNVASGLSFLVGGLVAYALSGGVDVAFLIPFAAGNFVYIAAADLVPQIAGPPACGPDGHVSFPLRERVVETLSFAVGLGGLLALALLS